MPIEFTSPGAAATEALQRFLVQQEARKRQDMLDEITRKKADRENQMAFEQLAIDQQQAALAREQAEGLKAQREAAAEANRQKRAMGVASILQPDTSIDENTASILRDGGMAALLKQQPGSRMAPIVPGVMTQPTSMDDAPPLGVPPSNEGAMAPEPTMATSYRGTPEQIQLQGILANPSTPDAVKNYLRARQAAGGEAVPYQLFDDSTGRLILVGRGGELQVQDPTTRQFRPMGPTDTPFNKDRDQIVQEPAPTSQNQDHRNVVLFNQIANAADRSPLIRAADRTITLQSAIKDIESDPTNPANQMALAYGYIQALDTYQSAVREGELQNLGTLGTKLQQLAIEANKIATTGAFMPPQVANEIATNAKRLVAAIETGKKRKMAEFASRAKASGVSDLWNEYVSGFPAMDQPTSQAPASGGEFVRDANGRLVRKP